MDRRAKRNIPDDAAANTGDKENATAPKMTKVVLAEFFATITGIITTAVATTVSAVQPAPTPRYSTAIDPFNTKSMELTSRDGRGQWYNAMEKTGGWKEISLVTVNADIVTNLLTERTTYFGFDPIINVST